VQHATARFHLGSLLLERNEPEAAAAEIAQAVELFEKLPVEKAKARNLWGAARRNAGHLDDAATAFADAATTFESAGLPLEQGAALFNLGLVQRQIGEADAAVDHFTVAAGLFDGHGAPRQAAAARREQGAALLAAGRATDAVPLLADALALAERADRDDARGQAANALGLALLGSGDTAGAITNLRQAVAAHPAAIRPDANAMAKANLALAYEASGDHSRARLAAAQALAGQSSDPALRDQAAAVLARLGEPGDDLAVVLADEAEERWIAVLREETSRWLRLDPARRAAAAVPLVDGIEGSLGPAGAEAWLHVLLEVPPDQMVDLVRLVWSVAGRRTAFARTVRDAIVTFPPPQLFRLEAVFAAETDLGSR